MDYTILFDRKDPISIETFARQLEGKTFQQVFDDADKNVLDDKANRGKIGQLIERYYFHYECNNDSNPDFIEAGVELKVTPYKVNKNGTISAKERLVLTKINYDQIVNETFETSHLWHKSKLLLLIYYLYIRGAASRFDYEIKHSRLFTPPEKDVLVIKKDFEIIAEKVRNGLAHKLSERDTMYLSACTKGAKKTDRTTQPFCDIPAKPRAFSYKTSYMTYILNKYIIPDRNTYIPFTSLTELKHDNIEEIIQNKLSYYIGMYVSELVEMFGIELNENNKGNVAILVSNMLGVKSTRIEEFAKAGIVIRTLTYRKFKILNQQFRLEDFKFQDLDIELFDDEVLDVETLEPIGWEYSELYDYISNRKYLIAVFWEEKDGTVFKGCQLWSMPEKDIEVVHSAWNELKSIVRKGVRLEKRGHRVTNNLPGIKHNKVFHVRNHSNKTFYVFSDGSTWGNGSLANADKLPDGRYMTKQAYWLNRSYIDSQLDSSLRRRY